MTGGAPKLRVSPAEFAHCQNPDWAAMTALAEQFGDAMIALAIGMHPTPPETFEATVTEAELVGAMARELHGAVASGAPVDALALAMLCACLWNRQPEAGVRRG